MSKFLHADTGADDDNRVMTIPRAKNDLWAMTSLDPRGMAGRIYLDYQ